jgi:hypothetical protein
MVLYSLGGLPGRTPTSTKILPTAKYSANAISKTPNPVATADANRELGAGAKLSIGESTVNGVPHSLQCKTASSFCFPQYAQAFIYAVMSRCLTNDYTGL